MATTAETHALRLRLDSREADRQISQTERQLDRLEKSGGRTSSMFAKLSGVMAGVGFAAMTKAMFDTNVESERLKGSLSTLLGGMSEANRAFDALNKFASQTPFTMEQSVQAFIKMKSLGLEPTAAALTSFGNTAAAMGYDLNQMIEAVADATTGEFERLKEFGIVARTEGDRVKFTFQGITTEVGKNAEEINAYLTSIGENQFAGAMADQMELLPGRVSNLQDSIGNLWRAIGDAGATSLFIDGINLMIDVLDTLTEAIRDGFAADWVRVHLEAFVEPFTWAIDSILLEVDRAKEADIWGFLQTEGPELLLDTLSLLPTGIAAVFQMLVVLVDTAIKQIVLELKFLDQQAAIVAGEIDKGFATLWGFVTIGAAKMVDGIRELWADLITWLAEKIPDVGPFAGWKDDLEAAAAGVRTLANAEQEAIDALDATLGAYDARIAAHERQLKILEDQMQTNKDFARGEIQIQIERIQAARERLQLAREEVEQEYARTQALEDANAVIDEYAENENDRVEINEALVKGLKERDKLEADVREELDKLLAKLDPAIAKEQKLAEMREVVNMATGLNIISEEERQALLEQLPALLEKGVEAEEAFSKAIESGIERLDGVFADLWTGFLDGADFSFDSVADSFKQMQGELIQQALRPITMKIQTKIDEQSEKYGGVQMGLGMLVGSVGGGLLGGGGQGAQTGAGIGSMVGAIWGPIGSAIGGLLGGLAGGMFDRELNVTLGGPARGGAAADAQRLTTPFGDVIGYSGGGGYGSFDLPGTPGGQIGEAIMEFDTGLYDLIRDFGSEENIAAISDALYRWTDSFEGEAVNAETVIASRWEAIIGAFDEGTRNFVTSAYALEDQVSRLGVALAAGNLVEDGEAFVGDRTREEILALVDILNGATGDITETFQTVVGELIAAQGALDILGDFTGGDILADFADQQETASRSLLDTLRASGDEVSRLGDEFDNTLSGAANLAGAIQQRYALELQMLAQIEGVLASIESRFQSLDEMIVSAISTPEENTERLRDRMYQLSEAIKSAVDPEEIDRITSEFERVTRAYWNSLDDEQRAALGPDLQAWIGEVEALAVARMEQIRADVLSEGELLREEVRLIMEGIGDPLTLVANEHQIAAEMLQDAARALGAGDPSGGPPGEGGRPPGGEYPYLPQEVIDVSISNVEVASAAASTLKSEGEAYREATGRLGGAINSAIARIPTKFDVRVKLDLSGVRSKELHG